MARIAPALSRFCYVSSSMFRLLTPVPPLSMIVQCSGLEVKGFIIVNGELQGIRKCYIGFFSQVSAISRCQFDGDIIRGRRIALNDVLHDAAFGSGVTLGPWPTAASK